VDLPEKTAGQWRGVPIHAGSLADDFGGHTTLNVLTGQMAFHSQSNLVLFDDAVRGGQAEAVPGRFLVVKKGSKRRLMMDSPCPGRLSER